MRNGLYLVATPIGNLEDISLRALNVLRDVDLIACEDTRHTIKLLNHYQIEKKLISYHEHNEQLRGSELLEELLRGSSVALVSDAGTPGISDPGEVLVRMAIEQNIPVYPIPGPTALISGLIASGLESGEFAFAGFLPEKNKDRDEKLKLYSEWPRTVIFYVSPHNYTRDMQDFYLYFGERNVVIAREITKMHEEFRRGVLGEEFLMQYAPLGEIVIIIAGKKEDLSEKDKNPPEEEGLKSRLSHYISKGLSRNTALRILAEETGLSRNEIYKIIFKGNSEAKD